MKYIENRSIYGTSISEIIIPAAVEKIDKNAFKNCNSLTKVIINSSTIAALNESTSCMLNSATTVYVKDTISTVGAYITDSFTQTTSDKAGYNKYVKNS